jgi:hypothetical protein
MFPSSNNVATKQNIIVDWKLKTSKVMVENNGV